MERLGLYDAMPEKLGNEVEPLKTYQWGCKPIDTIFRTRGVNVCPVDYLPFGEGVGDYRALFVNVTIVSALGVNLSPDKRAKARKPK